MRVACRASAALLLAGVAGAADRPAPRPAFEEHAEVTRGIAIVRIDPKRGAPPGECDDLSPADLTVTVGGTLAVVTSVERMPRPDRHWLLIDTSESATERRNEAKRSARDYVRSVMSSGEDRAALLTVDEDTLLQAGPTSDLQSVSDRIDTIVPGDYSALRDGLADVLRQVQGDRHEHLILYWTDGLDTMSLTTESELMEILAAAPNATVFPIALIPEPKPGESGRMVGSFLFDVAKRSGAEVFSSSDARWLERARGWIARRFAVAYAPAEEKATGPVALALRGKRCQLTVLPDPFVRAAPQAGAAQPAPDSWRRIYERQKRKSDDAACLAAAQGATWDWPLEAGPTGLAGCVLDVIEAPGPLVQRHEGPRPVDVLPARFAMHRVKVATPSPDTLPASLDDALDAFAPDATIEGSTFLTQRARLAASLFAARPEYRDFALARLGDAARHEMRRIELGLARDFPDLPPDRIAAVARESRAGRRALLAAEQPTDADLARVLAAWLRDRPAREVALAWERKLIAAHLAGAAHPDDAQRWIRARDRLSVPAHVRVLVPLFLVMDQTQGVVGFERIVLPRPEGFTERSVKTRASKDRPDDRLPERPLALWLVDRLLADSRVAGELRAGTYALSGATYAELDPPWKANPAHPFRRARVSVTLVSAVRKARLEARADVEAPPGVPETVLAFAAQASGDRALDKALEAFSSNE